MVWSAVLCAAISPCHAGLLPTEEVPMLRDRDANALTTSSPVAGFA